MKHADFNPNDFVPKPSFFKDLWETILRLKWPLLIYVALWVVNLIFYVNSERNTFELLFIILFSLVFFVAILYMPIMSTIHASSRKKHFEELGSDKLLNELKNPETDFFALDPAQKNSYIAITENYLFLSFDHVYPLADLAQVYVNMADYSYQVKSYSPSFGMKTPDRDKPFNPKSKNPKEVLRFVKPLDIKFKDGHSEKSLVALYEADAMEFQETINYALYRVNNPDNLEGYDPRDPHI